jgi:hypothetical protein
VRPLEKVHGSHDELLGRADGEWFKVVMAWIEFTDAGATRRMPLTLPALALEVAMGISPRSSAGKQSWGADGSVKAGAGGVLKVLIKNS